MLDPASREDAVAPHRWRSPALGESLLLDLPQGPLECFRRGAGPALVFAHGWLANANLWRKVVDLLAPRFLCVTLDLPFGSHRLPLRGDADLAPEGCGRLIGDALAALALADVTLVGNDSGGAYAQIALASSPGSVRRLVLISCETPYDAFPPPPFDGLPAAARDPATLARLLGALRDPEVRRSPAAYGLLMKHATDAGAFDSYVLPCLEEESILRDVCKVMAAAETAPVHAAGRRLIAELRRPVLFAWSAEDPVFPLAHAERYATVLADARVVVLPDAYGFIAEDQPVGLAAALAAFVLSC